MLELTGLSRRFGGLTVIDDLALRVQQGEIVGILGPNGAGKSTLFNLIGGNLAPNAGHVVYEGRDITRMRVWDRARMGIGRTFQIPKPFMHMSVFENVLAAAVHGGKLSVAKATPRAAEVLERTGLAHRSTVQAGQLTLLDLKRLELAKALAQAPKLLLLDEIAGGLSEAECEELLAIVGGEHAAGTTIVWIEHVVLALRRLATRIDVLYGGRILVSGTPEQVLADQRVQEVYLGA
ncbi:MAG TPA: ABC transporter ATP-binding protein [Candidatus Sulfotelmatobacter sp.]|nr:ABC transporter ATP-binding protein [Candidatus Sulfotelmatobacter sp.]